MPKFNPPQIPPQKPIQSSFKKMDNDEFRIRLSNLFNCAGEDIDFVCISIDRTDETITLHLKGSVKNLSYAILCTAEREECIKFKKIISLCNELLNEINEQD
ncbi:hypothetical protein ACT4R9_05470 [Ornithobacterium rhinotracheale]|uniref:hypothetical protein n=1 Tax=Ornithobacterium rhinotracheale TaxID=28251 RepID=UPI003FA45FE1